MAIPEAEAPQEPPRGAAAIFGPTVNAVFAPEKAFAALDARPLLAVWPMIWTVVGMIGLAVWNLDVSRQLMRVGAVEGMMRQGGEPDPEQLASTMEMMDRFAPIWAIGGNLFILVLVALIAVALWVGSSLLGGRTAFGRALGVAGVGAVIHPLLATTFVSVMWKIDPPEIRRMSDFLSAMPSLGLDMFFRGGDLSLPVLTLLARVDLFNIWWMVVVVIGAQRLLGLKRGQAVALVVTVWGLSAGISAVWAGMSG